MNDKLVRGLDYYGHTAFEFTSKNIGAQGTVLAGGRYNNLISQMGGPETPGIGWAAGVERLTLLLGQVQNPDRPISVIPVHREMVNETQILANQLRRKGFFIELGYSGNLSKRMKRASKVNASAVVLLGEDEASRNVVLVRDMDTGEQIEVSLDRIDNYLETYK